MIKKYLRYLLSAKNAHGIHSPFVFELYCSVLRHDPTDAPDYARIENIRKKMLRDPTTISITDLGAGSKVNASNERKIRDIAKNSKKPAKFGRLFYRLVQKFRSDTIVDLGTSLGITTLYLAQARPQATVITFEGCPQTVQIAKQNFDECHAHNVEIVVGNLDQTLPKRLESIEKIDLAFFDANHRFEPTVRYFENCLGKAHQNSVFIFDDIHWSDDMELAWQTIKDNPRVRVTIDLFFVGIVFFKETQTKQHFTVWY